MSEHSLFEKEIFLIGGDAVNQDNLLQALLIHSCQTNKLTAKKKDIAYEAIKIFAEEGFSNASTAKIAKNAGVAEATIFKHYGSKENLLLTVVIPYIKVLLPEILDEVISEVLTSDVTRFDQFLRGFLKNRSDFIAKNKEVFQVFVKEMIYTEAIKSEFLSYFEDYTKPRFIEIIEHFKERGEFAGVSNEEVFQMVCTFIGGFFVSKFVVMNVDYIQDEEIEEVVTFIMRGTRNTKE